MTEQTTSGTQYFLRYLRCARGMSSAETQAAEDLERGISYLGYDTSGDAGADQRGAAFAGLCGYRVAGPDTILTNTDYSDCPYFAVYTGAYLGRDDASDGDLFRPAELVSVRHMHLVYEDGELVDYRTDEEMAEREELLALAGY